MEDYSEMQKMIEAKRKEGAFIFMPSPILSMENSFYMPVMSEPIILREDEIYKATGNYRMHYNGLLRIAGAAGFEWSAIDTRRTDKQNDRLYCSFMAVGGVRKADGKVYFHKAEKDIDLEIIEMELEDQYKAGWLKVKDCKGNQAWKKHGHEKESTFVAAMVRRDLIQKRKNKLMLVESGAKARVIRFVLGLQGQYSNEKDLKCEYIMIHYSLNPKHPDVKQSLMKSLSVSQNMVYGGAGDTGLIAHDDPDLDYNTPDTITIPPDKPENPETSGFKPTKDTEPEIGSGEDFERQAIDAQIKTLKYMCKSSGQDYDSFDRQTDNGLEKTDQKWRSDFFNFLKDQREDQK